MERLDTADRLPLTPFLERRGMAALLWLGVAAAFGLYAQGFVNSVAGDGAARDRQLYLRQVMALRSLDLAGERALAEAYWSRNPDVAADAVFGEHGRMGLFGARQHYQLHGHREGRRWGLSASAP
ncbi:MAG: hypothetical protein GC191_19870 [Azospirillum sp.]|nr:hypothetical protein [Azospirillum sp.]